MSNGSELSADITITDAEYAEAVESAGWWVQSGGQSALLARALLRADAAVLAKPRAQTEAEWAAREPLDVGASFVAFAGDRTDP